MMYSYASQVLRDQGIKIRAGGKQILNHPYELRFPKITSIIEKSSEYIRGHVEKEGIKEIKNYEDLLSLGFKLVKYNTSEDFRYQKVGYFIARLNYPGSEEQVVTKMPQSHYILHDLVNEAIQGVGRNFGFAGKTDWFPLKRDAYGTDQNDRKSLFDKSLEKTRDKFKSAFYHKKIKASFTIPEGVLGITDRGYIATIPKPSKIDPQFRVIVGGRRVGKSMLENTLEDIDFHKFNTYCVNANDITGETKTRCLAWDDSFLKSDLERFGEPSVPKPAVYLHPTTNENYPRIYPEESGFDTSIPLRELLSDDKLITYNRDWDMKTSSTLLEWRKLISKDGKLRRDGLAFVTSLDDARRLLSEIKEKGMYEKASRVLADIFNTNMVDKASNVPAKWVMEKDGAQKIDSPWNVCMRAGLFPYINTSNIRKRELWFALFLRYVIEDIISFAVKQDKVTNLYLDEIEPLLKDKITREIIETAIRECGKQHMSITMVSHNYAYVKQAIYTHTTGMSSYKFIFNTAEKELIAAVQKEGLTKERAMEIRQLKQFQCFAFGRFILYDLDGNKFENDGPIKIVKIKPPNCRHYGG